MGWVFSIVATMSACALAPPQGTVASRRIAQALEHLVHQTAAAAAPASTVLLMVHAPGLPLVWRGSAGALHPAAATGAALRAMTLNAIWLATQAKP
jgi:hypothetical protein